MPEISQDAFEILNPGFPSVSSVILRSRLNSLGAYKSSSSKLCVNQTELNKNQKNFANKASVKSENMANVADKKHDMEPQTIINGLSAIDTVSHSYKRVLDHR